MVSQGVQARLPIVHLADVPWKPEADESLRGLALESMVGPQTQIAGPREHGIVIVLWPTSKSRSAAAMGGAVKAAFTHRHFIFEFALLFRLHRLEAIGLNRLLGADMIVIASVAFCATAFQVFDM
jgi:hypothetical protein